MKEKKMKIGEVSKITGVSKDSIRRYDAQGLLGSVERTTSNSEGHEYRQFGEAVIPIIRKVSYLTLLGFNFEEIKEILDGQEQKIDLGVLKIRHKEQIDEKRKRIEQLKNEIEQEEKIIELITIFEPYGIVYSGIPLGNRKEMLGLTIKILKPLMAIINNHVKTLFAGKKKSITEMSEDIVKELTEIFTDDSMSLGEQIDEIYTFFSRSFDYPFLVMAIFYELFISPPAQSGLTFSFSGDVEDAFGFHRVSNDIKRKYICAFQEIYISNIDKHMEEVLDRVWDYLYDNDYNSGFTLILETERRVQEAIGIELSDYPELIDDVIDYHFVPLFRKYGFDAFDNKSAKEIIEEIIEKMPDEDEEADDLTLDEMKNNYSMVVWVYIIYKRLWLPYLKWKENLPQTSDKSSNLLY